MFRFLTTVLLVASGWIVSCGRESAVAQISEIPSPKNTMIAPSPARVRDRLDLKMSDVLLSSRWRHPSDKKDTRDTMETIAAFHVTRMEWSYDCSPDYIAECRKHGVRCFQGTINTFYKTGKQYTDKALPGHETSQQGTPVTGPWMKVIFTWWGCVNSKEYREDYLARLQKMIDAGVNSIQMDDPGLNRTAVNWGACYCNACFEKFNQYLLKTTDSQLNQGYKTLTREQFLDPTVMKKLRPLFEKFQEESVQLFYEEMKPAIAQRAKKTIPFSSNNYGGRWTFPYYLFDFGCSEVGKKSLSPDGLLKIQQSAHSLGRIQNITLALRNRALNRAVFATTYASGGHMILPWDVYIPPTLSPRLFLEPEEFADLPGFVRAMAPMLDGCPGESKGTGFSFTDALPEITVSNSHSKVALFVRKGTNKNVTVLHLVDWRDVPDKIDEKEPAPGASANLFPSPTTLQINADLFAGRLPGHATLWTPAPYNASAHEQAERTGDYSPLTIKTELPVVWKENRATLTVPPVSPWGMIVFQPEK